MQDNKRFKVGDKIIDFGQVYRIFKIKKKILFYRPYFKTKRNKGIVCSIPVKNVDKAKIRKPISKRQLKKIFNRLSEPQKINGPLQITKLREKLRFNDAFKTAQTLKTIWLDKNDESTNFTRPKKEVFDLTMKRLVEEVALVKKLSLATARKRINKALGKMK